jgi:hypothetical protein
MLDAGFLVLDFVLKNSDQIVPQIKEAMEGQQDDALATHNQSQLPMFDLQSS